MKIRFNQDIKIAGIGIVPWTRLGPEEWLKDYAIASLYGWDVADADGMPPVFALSDTGCPLPQLAKLNTKHLLATTEFQELLNTHLPGYDLLTYKPVEIPAELADRKFLMVNPSFTARFENKAVFREMFEGKIRFPAYTIVQRADLHKDEATFAQLMGSRSRIVLQDEQLSGGTGTHIVSTFEEYQKAVDDLNAMSQHSRVVVSEAISSPKERSIQCCVTRHGVLTGPLQRQIVRDPLLANMAVAEGDKFCGAQILAADQKTKAHAEATEIAQKIGMVLQAEGYRGIFGIDFLMDESGELYVLEINPRITGVTPLLTAMYKGEEGIPFYLLHLLELGGYDYTVDDTHAEFDKDGALLVVHSLETHPVRVLKTPSSGTYCVRNDELVKLSDNIDLAGLRGQEFIIQEYIPAGMPVKPGGRFLRLQFATAVIDFETDVLYNSTSTIIKTVQKHIVTEKM